jgi:hypothetical protein
MRSPRYPRCDRHLDYEEQHDQSRLQSLNSKHNVLHREQRLRDVKVELCGDKEYVQIYEVELRPEVREILKSNEE